MKQCLLKAKLVDINTGGNLVVFLNHKDADKYDIKDSDRLMMTWKKAGGVVVEVQVARDFIPQGQIGLSREIQEKLNIQAGEEVKLRVIEIPDSVRAITRQLSGVHLDYDQIHSIIYDIVNYRLDDIMVAFYLAGTFWNHADKDEIYNVTKAMVDTGHVFEFEGKVVDKHSTGGLSGNRITPIIVSIVASLGVKFPKTSSRAVTSPAGTADTMEVLTPVTFDNKEIKEIVDEVEACLVWGAKDIAPADDRIIKVAHQLPTEPMGKMITSIMSKKVAMGAKYLIIDIPVNATAKIKTLDQAKEIKDTFQYLGKRFGIEVKVVPYESKDPVGQGIGPALEARDVLRVMQGKDNRPLDLEKKAVFFAGQLLELVDEAEPGEGVTKAQKQLNSGQAWEKLQQIIEAQGGNPNIDSEEVKIGTQTYDVKADQDGRVKMVDDSSLDWVARSLGAPSTKEAGVYLHKGAGDSVKKGETLLTLYTNSEHRLKMAREDLKDHKIYHVG